MALRHTINWESKHKNITTNIDNRNWLSLKEKFTNKPITRFNLILYCLQTNDYNQNRKSINRLIRNDLLSLPSGELFTLHNNHVDFKTFLKRLSTVSSTHSAYALLSLRFVCEFCNLSIAKFARLTVGEYNKKGEIVGVDIILPHWLSIILDRQKEIAYSIGMTDDDPLFFVMRWSDMNKSSLRVRSIRINDPEITDTLYKFRMRYGHSISEYIDDFILFAGMKSDSILQIMPPNSGTRFNSVRSLYGKLVTIYEYNQESRRRQIRNFGYLVWAHKGLYLVHTTEGLWWCPYYLLGEPTVRPGREKDNRMKVDLHQLGYKPSEFYESIKDHKTLRGHTIQRRKL